MNPAALKHLEAGFIYGYISLSSIKCVYAVSSQNHPMSVVYLWYLYRINPATLCKLQTASAVMVGCDVATSCLITDKLLRYFKRKASAQTDVNVRVITTLRYVSKRSFCNPAMRIEKPPVTMATIPLLLLHVNYSKTSERSSPINQALRCSIRWSVSAHLTHVSHQTDLQLFPSLCREGSMTPQNFSRSTLKHLRNVSLKSISQLP